MDTADNGDRRSDDRAEQFGRMCEKVDTIADDVKEIKGDLYRKVNRNSQALAFIAGIGAALQIFWGLLMAKLFGE